MSAPRPAEAGRPPWGSSKAAQPHGLVSRLRGVCAALLLAMAAAAGAAPWADAPYSQYPRQQPLEQVLREFAASFNLGLQLTPAVSGVVNGRLAARNPTEFMDRLAGVYGLAWFTHAGTLHVARVSETLTRTLAVPGGAPGPLRRALTDIGVLDARFGWGELPEQGLVMVSGPPQYVALVERSLAALPGGTGGQQVAVFRLRHASVDDRTFLYRDREITTPGLASVIRHLVNGSGGGTTDGVATVREPAPVAAASPASSPVAGIEPRLLRRARTPTVQADARINALIVQDAPERMPMYEQLVAQLDVPTALIEIEAMIIDVNSQRLEELGISWSARVGRVSAGFGNLNAQDDGRNLSMARSTGPASAGNVAVLTGDYLVARLRALESQGEAQIQSRPSILTVDNVGALIDLSETFYIRTTGERVASVTPVTTGTSLRVTPRVIDGPQGRAVQMAVDIEDGQIQDRQVDTLPTVRRSVVNTQALVAENATLLIGGYRSDQKTLSSDRVPVLGSLPLVGALFSTRSSDVQKRERLFMIRPRVVGMPETADASTPR